MLPASFLIVEFTLETMTYQTIDAILARHDADSDAAEAHGIATGMLCVDERVAANTWLDELFKQASELSDEETKALLGLYERTRQLLGSDDVVFDLFLPDDEDAMLMQQAEALCSWCHGFLFGIGYGYSSATWPAIVAQY